MKDVKVGTAIDAELLRRAKTCAARRGKKLHEVFEEALRLYLAQEPDAAQVGSIRDSWAALKVKPRDLKQLMVAPLWYETE